MYKPFADRKIAVIFENRFIPEEIEAFHCCFSLLGATVDFISRIWCGEFKPSYPYWKSLVFYRNVDPAITDSRKRPRWCGSSPRRCPGRDSSRAHFATACGYSLPTRNYWPAARSPTIQR